MNVCPLLFEITFSCITDLDSTSSGKEEIEGLPLIPETASWKENVLTYLQSF